MFRPVLAATSASTRFTSPVWPPATDVRPVPNMVSNASSTSGDGLGSTAALMKRIAACDKRLCQLTAMVNRQRSRHVLVTSERADILNTVDTLQRALARRTSVSLHRWLAASDPGIRPDPDRLQDRIQHAGLIQILRVMPTGDLSTAQRLRLAATLRDVGAHPGTVRAWLGLDASDGATSEELDVERLDDPPASAASRHLLQLLERILPSARAAKLDRAEVAQGMAQTPADSASASQYRAGRDRLLTRKEKTYQHAILVSGRFGYGPPPAWKYMGRLKDPRTKKLDTLDAPRAKKRKRAEHQLP